MTKWWRNGACLTLMLGLAALPARAQKPMPGITDTEIKIGQNAPFSGPASVYGQISTAESAYFKMINDRGGINGRKLNLIALDDGYSPPKAIEVVRRLVEDDQVAILFQTLGTASNAAIPGCSSSRVRARFMAARGVRRGRSERILFINGRRENVARPAF